MCADSIDTEQITFMSSLLILAKLFACTKLFQILGDSDIFGSNFTENCKVLTFLTVADLLT